MAVFELPITGSDHFRYQVCNKRCSFNHCIKHRFCVKHLQNAINFWYDYFYFLRDTIQQQLHFQSIIFLCCKNAKFLVIFQPLKSAWQIRVSVTPDPPSGSMKTWGSSSCTNWDWSNLFTARKRLEKINPHV